MERWVDQEETGMAETLSFTNYGTQASQRTLNVLGWNKRTHVTSPHPACAHCSCVISASCRLRRECHRSPQGWIILG